MTPRSLKVKQEVLPQRFTHSCFLIKPQLFVDSVIVSESHENSVIFIGSSERHNSLSHLQIVSRRNSPRPKYQPTGLDKDLMVFVTNYALLHFLFLFSYGAFNKNSNNTWCAKLPNRLLVYDCIYCASCIYSNRTSCKMPMFC